MKRIRELIVVEGKHDRDRLEKLFDCDVICTDGLSNCVTTGDMVKICHENRGDSLIGKLVDLAKENGGSDNITATVIY